MRLPRQSNTLLQQAGAEHSIRSEHGVAVRLLGFVDGAADVDPATYAGMGELKLHPTGAWKMLGEAPVADPEAEVRAVEATLAAHAAALEDATAAFRDRCETIRETGQVPEDPLDTSMQRRADDAGTAGAPGADTRPCNPDANMAMQRIGQRFAALGILHHEGQTIVCPLGARDSEDDCRAWIKGTLARVYKSFDVYCVEMYQWIYPDLVSGRQCGAEIPFDYGGDDGGRLTELMQYQVDEDAKQDDFARDMDGRGIEQGKYITEVGAPVAPV